MLNRGGIPSVGQAYLQLPWEVRQFLERVHTLTKAPVQLPRRQACGGQSLLGILLPV